MSKKRSDALQALIAEAVDLIAAVDVELAREEEARQDTVRGARQVLDTVRGAREAAQRRLETTEEALRIIQARDEIADEVVAALRERAAR